MKTEGMTPFTHITLALDLSLTSSGIAVIAITEGQPIILEASHIPTLSKHSHGHRLWQISDEIERYFKAYSPEHVVREKGFSRFPAVTQALFKVVGCSDMVAHIYGHTVAEIPPTTVKKAITGSGKASKDEDAAEDMRVLRIQDADYFATDDESDAAAVGITFLKQKGLITL